MDKLVLILLATFASRISVDGQPTCVNGSVIRLELSAEEARVGDAVLEIEGTEAKFPMELSEGIPEGAPIQVCVYTSGAELRFFLTRRMVKE